MYMCIGRSSFQFRAFGNFVRFMASRMRVHRPFVSCLVGAFIECKDERRFGLRIVRLGRICLRAQRRASIDRDRQASK